MEDQTAVFRWLDCNLLEWQGKEKSGPGCFVLPLADFTLGLRLSSTGFEMGKLIFETPPCTASHTDGRLRCRIFSNPIFLACLICLLYFAFSFLKNLACLSFSGSRCVLLCSLLPFYEFLAALSISLVLLRVVAF
ncbi:hypothetical protein AVEN_64123-1 [Araneus ventricosus]|uniref:Uncharacterized protein n=1 Tax=Araneus ventricosus TaxID=182803 RepID=A0A4Y2C450_ARAVE|nr:hypothetical protein AVEN_64123-1 [Araneus ventricosus]